MWLHTRHLQGRMGPSDPGLVKLATIQLCYKSSSKSDSNYLHWGQAWPFFVRVQRGLRAKSTEQQELHFPPPDRERTRKRGTMMSKQTTHTRTQTSMTAKGKHISP